MPKKRGKPAASKSQNVQSTTASRLETLKLDDDESEFSAQEAPAAVPQTVPASAARPAVQAQPVQRIQPIVQQPAVEPPEGKAPAQAPAPQLTLPSTKPKRTAEDFEKMMAGGDNVEREKLKTHELMKRPNIGKKGQRIQLYANYYPVTLKPLQVLHYDMAVWRKAGAKKVGKGKEPPPDAESGDGISWISVSRLPRFLSILLLNELYSKNTTVFRNRYGLAFDGQKNLISTYELPGMPNEFVVKITNPEKQLEEEFKIKIKLASRINVDIRRIFDPDLRERDSIATLVYDIVLKMPYFFDQSYIPCGRRIFYYPQPVNKFPLGGGTYCYPGFWQSLRPVDGWKIMINQDLANTAFVQGGTVLDLLTKELNCNINQPIKDMRGLSRRLEKIVKGLKITQTQRAGPRTAKCDGVSSQPASELKFPVEENGRSYTTTVAEYFVNQYKTKTFTRLIKYPHLMCLRVGKKGWIPVEFCEIKAGQRYPRKLDGFQTSAMLKAASKTADVRKNLIEEDMKFLKMNENPYFKEFGISVSNEMVKFDGRVLPAPTIRYSNQNARVMNGGWNMRENRLIKGCTIRNFAILITCRLNQNDIEQFVYEWHKSATAMGITVQGDNPIFVKQQWDAEKIASELHAMKLQCKTLDLVFVVLEAQNTDHYAHAKQAGDVVEGINTQCIQMKNVRMPKPATMANVNLKINGKLGGVNSSLSAQDMKSIKDWINDEIMYMGADVNHDAPDDTSREEPVSCAAIVASIDNAPSQFCARIFLQHQERTTQNGTSRRPQEWISNMQDGVHMALENYVRGRGRLPRRIIMYRDGVGETMFGLVLERELLSIREACESFAQRNPTILAKSGLKGRYEPPVTFIVVQKRHHTRLFCVNPREAMERNGFNVPPGTTVDTTITHPVEFDFFLCSHLGLQGTSKPAHYHVLWDENKFTADELQTLTYFLCYTYCRSTRSVSIPPPCYYADLVAYRARQYLKAIFGGSETASQVSGASAGRMSLADMQRLVNVNLEIVRKGMYFV